MSVNKLTNTPINSSINLPSKKTILIVALMAVESCNFQGNENKNKLTLKDTTEQIDINLIIKDNVVLSSPIASELVNEIDQLCENQKWQEIHLKLQDNSEMTFFVDQIDLKKESNNWWGFNIVMLMWSYKEEDISLSIYAEYSKKWTAWYSWKFKKNGIKLDEKDANNLIQQLLIDIKTSEIIEQKDIDIWDRLIHTTPRKINSIPRC